MEKSNVAYLGDGVYINWNGYSLELMTGDSDDPIDVIYMNDEILANFIEYVKKFYIIEGNDRD
ncbi:MAG TPA: hypothetical protein DC057_03385 [Spirochaetia bacterium]|nr:hypothetical protein [Spirochaetia bacterium]